MPDLMNLPLVSICIPLYNKVEYIDKTLFLALEQTYPNLEVVVCDNASNDGSDEIVKRHQSNDSRIKYHRLENTISMIDNWRYVVRLAKGEFIHILCADDVIELDFIEKMISPLLADSSLDFSVCSVKASYTGDIEKDFVVNTSNYMASVNHFNQDLLSTVLIEDKKKKIAFTCLFANYFGPVVNVLMKQVCLPIADWGSARASLGCKAHPDWDILIRTHLNYKGFFVNENLAHFSYNKDSCTLQYFTDTGNHLASTIDQFLIGLTSLTDHSFAHLRDTLTDTTFISARQMAHDFLDASINAAINFDRIQSGNISLSRHIAVYTDDPGIYGVAQYNHVLMKELLKQGYQVTCIQGHTSNHLVEERISLGIKHFWLESNEFAHSFTNSLEATALIQNIQPDLIIFSNCCPISNFAAKRAAIELNTPYIVIEGFVGEYLADRFANYLPELGQHYQQARQVISVSDENKQLLHKRFNLNENHGQTIYYGKPVEYFEPVDLSSRKRLRQELGIPNDAVVCFTAARMETVKGYQYQLAAISQLKDMPTCQNLYFVWAGDGSLLLQIKQSIEELGVSDRVKLLGVRSDIDICLNMADIFILPSELEGMPHAIMEAMAKGLPVIASNVSGIPEELGNTGKLLRDPTINSQCTIAELVHTLNSWAEDSSLRQKLGRACQERALQLFTEERMFAETLEVVKYGLLPLGDYVSPRLKIVEPDICFPNKVKGNPDDCGWSYLRKEVPHNWYVDRRNPVVGFLSRDEAHILYNTARKFEGQRVLEIGCWLGWSACHLALAGTELDVVDPLLEHAEFYDSVSNSLKAAGVRESVHLHPGFSPAKVSEIAAQLQQKWPLIFIDGNHEAPGPLDDAIACEKLATDDAIILFHDLSSPDVAQGLDYFKKQGWNTMVYQTMQIMGVAWRGNVEPLHHIPDPRVQWELPMHLQDYIVSGLDRKSQNSEKVRAIDRDLVNNLNSDLAINFFTIVLNGMPYLPYHIDVFKQLECDWHWHIVEGVANLNHDTSWSVRLGGSVSDDIHVNGLSKDGTTEYLDELAKSYPDNITIYRKPLGEFWDGKREMVNAPLINIKEECLLWQVDVDELWTLEQLNTARQLFINNPTKTAAFYWCWYFVGEELLISTRNCYAQNPNQEWLRTWKFKPGVFWAAHEPPVLVEAIGNSGEYRDIAKINPFVHAQTESAGLVFQHFAYATQEQLSFKEQYYGYQDAVSQWLQLQAVTKFPVFLQDYFAWVGDRTQVDTARSMGIVPIAQVDAENTWRFLLPEEVACQTRAIEEPISRILIDGVFFQLYNTGIARLWKSLLEEWANTEFGKHIVLLDRVGTAPRIQGIRYCQIPAYDYNNTDADRQMLQQVCNQLGAELFLSTYYTTPLETPSIFMAYDMIPEVLGVDLNFPMWQEKRRAIEHATSYLAISKNTKKDLAEIYTIDPAKIAVAHCGVASIFQPAAASDGVQFRHKYGITNPYFIIGSTTGYKNISLFVKAFARLPFKTGVDIVCTGGNRLDAELSSLLLNTRVHYLSLDDRELSIAYNQSLALVYPSKYEGFGMPLVEAMASGCPVITCRNSSLTEVCYFAALYISDSDDVTEMEAALCNILNPTMRDRLIDRGIQQARKFSWKAMADSIETEIIKVLLDRLQLRDTNLIIFPDWSKDEMTIAKEFMSIVIRLAESFTGTLLVDVGSNPDNYEFVMDFIFNIIMSVSFDTDIDLDERFQINPLGELISIQWSHLKSYLAGKIDCEMENVERVSKVGYSSLNTYVFP